MNVEEAIYRKLADNAAVVALAGDRLYPGIVQGDPEFPCVIWNKVASTTDPTHGEPVGVRFDLFQFACFAINYAAVAELAAAVVAALDGQPIGTSGNATLEGERDDYDESADMYRRDVDFRI